MHIFRISVPLVCLFYHFIVVIITFVNFAIFVRLQITSEKRRDAYLAFSVIEAVAYGACAGPLFVYAYKYGETPTARMGCLLWGIAIMFLFSSLPLLIIELIQFLSSGYQLRHTLDGIVFFLHGIAATVGGCTSWFAYMHVVARDLQRWRGPERQIAEDSENLFGKDAELGLVKCFQRQSEAI
ncbi:hypothetical protein GH5_03873 [Leishmania sp. Ghana 2012 LV757]|uniref:hypothetical protein n=1 Tax=Leishmania sp. Ghana 2012 LV757 TaxID=2803181 RepID=UPI001B740290|nr:hypothetical protein GH5_03873 [Leishmania sp. Ghana 2012 LV757]